MLDNKKDYSSNMGALWTMTVKDFNAGNRAMRAFVGFGAGSASLDMTYVLKDTQGKTLEQWDDGVGTSQGGTYCAQTLNRRNVAPLSGKL